MSDKFLIKFLQIVSGNGNIVNLLNEGLEYAQIASLISTSLRDGFINRDSDGLILTSEGKQKINELNHCMGNTNSNKWISHLEIYKIDKLDIFDVYLPKKTTELR